MCSTEERGELAWGYKGGEARFISGMVEVAPSGEEEALSGEWLVSGGVSGTLLCSLWDVQMRRLGRDMMDRFGNQDSVECFTSERKRKKRRKLQQAGERVS